MTNQQISKAVDMIFEGYTMVKTASVTGLTPWEVRGIASRARKQRAEGVPASQWGMKQKTGPKPKPKPIIEAKPVKHPNIQSPNAGVATWCHGCRAKVYMPCKLCKTRQWKLEQGFVDCE